MSETKSQIMSFLELLEKYCVEIPMLQRDYAQGRTDARELREKFIKDLVAAASGKKHVHLDFIYGAVKKEGEGNIFTPLDGQQRLTTLFLLYWYLAIKVKDFDLLKKLKKFKYKVRVTSQEFINAILEKENVENEDLSKENIEDAKWYYSAWDFDPTVQGMLNTIDTIDKQLESTTNFAELWKQLETKEDCPITFNLLEMNEFKLGDELFIRMNARGLALTDFENFKAWLQEHASQFKNSEYFTSEKHWTEKIDRDWSELIWGLSDKDNTLNGNSFDEMYMRFFNSMAIACSASKYNKEQAEKITINDQEILKNPNLIEKIIKNQSVLISEDTKNCFPEDSLSLMFNYFDKLGADENFLKLSIGFQEKELYSFKSLLSKEGNEETETTRKRIIIAYAVAKFANETGDYTSEKFKRWTRVIRNLVENTSINNDLFINAIQSVDQLLTGVKENESDIVKYLASDSKIELTTFTGQIEEEILKANLIKANNKWEELILKAEDHPLFRGQIEFLLKKGEEESDNVYLSIFKKRIELSYCLWGGNGSKINNDEAFLLFRALLTCSCNYEFWWQKKLGAKNWKSNFLDENLSSSLITLLDQLDKDKSLQEQLQTAINHFPFSDNDWKSHIVKNGEKLLKISRDKKVQQCYDGGVYVSEKNNASGGDILICGHVKFRNDIIQSLILKNEFKLLYDWMEVNLETDFKYFKGHNIILTYLEDEQIQLKFQEKCLFIEIKENGQFIQKSEIQFSELSLDGDGITQQIKEEISASLQ